MQNKNQYPYVIDLATESAIAPLPDKIKNEIREYSSSSSHMFDTTSRILQGSYSVSYNRRIDDLEDLDLPQSLINKVNQGGGIPNPSDRFGTFGENCIVLNFQENAASDVGFLLIVSFEDFSSFIELLFPQCRFTPAELRVLMQILCGYSLGEAAIMDELTYETKRSQLKSIAGKTGFSTQKDLSVFISTRLTYELQTDHFTSSEYVKDAFDVHLEVMHPAVQLYVRNDYDGACHRIMDMGPKNGTPYLVIHGTGLPLLTDDDIDFLKDNSIRLVWPLRHGLMMPNSAIGLMPEYIDHYRRSILMALDTVADATTPISVISVGSGCSHAIEFHKSAPERIKCLNFITACYRPFSEVNSVNRVAQGIDKLAALSPQTLRLIFKVLVKSLKKESAFSKYMKGLAEGSDPDTAIVEYEISDPKRIKNFQIRTLGGPEFLVIDHCTRLTTDWQYLNSRNVDARFFHGTEDLFYPITGIEKLAMECGKPLEKIEGTGHFIYLEHFTKALARICD